MKKLNTVFSALLIVIAAVFFFYADSFKTLPNQQDIGPAAFPKTVSVLLAVAAVWNVIDVLRKQEDKKISLFNLKWAVGIAVAVGYYFLLKPLGFLLTSMIAVFILELLLLNEPVKKAWPLMTGVAVLAPAAIYIVFGMLLKVPLPTGVLAPILG